MSDKNSNKEHQYKINHSIADPNQEAATPVPAATVCLLYTSPSPRDPWKSRMPSSA